MNKAEPLYLKIMPWVIIFTGLIAVKLIPVELSITIAIVAGIATLIFRKDYYLLDSCLAAFCAVIVGLLFSKLLPAILHQVF